MRVLFVSSSLPNSLALENQSVNDPNICSNLKEISTVYTKKVISKTFASTSQVKSPILSTQPLISSLAQHQHAQKTSESGVPFRRNRSHSTTSQRTSISILNSEDQQINPEMIPKTFLNPIWKFTEMPGHAATSAASSIINDESMEKLFIGWPGPILNDQGKEVDYADLESGTFEQIKTLYKTEVDSIPVFLDPMVSEGHASYCNTTLWPILHYLVWENPVQCKKMPQDWNDYVKVNEAFAERILETYKTGDCIWILDHQLLLLPGILRQKLQSVPIGLYLRTTFPSSELFRCLPQAEDLLRGMLGANVIGFQAYAYARHFTSCCTRVLGLEASLQRIDYEGSPVELVVIPTGIGVDETVEMIKGSEVKDKCDRFIELYHGTAVLIGIDCFNQSKGVIQKLKAYETFLRDHPEWIGRVVLVQVILPEKELTNFSKSNDLSLITDMASQINGHYGSIEYAPITIYHQDIELAEYYALLQVADCYISTNERDSLSLGPLDFVLCQDVYGCKNPIILSEFTALSGSMSTSLLVNPWDHSMVSRAINSALIMPSNEKATRHNVLINYVINNSKIEWSRLFLLNLFACQELIEKYGPTAYLDFNLVKAAYKRSGDRYFFLDYDGTLTPIVKTPSAAIPGSKTIESLKRLTADPTNKVFVVSGRDSGTLEHWLGDIENLGMSAEHGCFLKMPGCKEWQNLIADQNDDWKVEVIQVFEYFTERSPGSFIEKKSASITWHYRQCDPEFGSWQAKQCQSLLENTISSKMAVEILAGKKNLEVRPISINKGQTLRKILSEGTDKIQADFVLCAGDDRTDEDMFKALMELEENQEFNQEPETLANTTSNIISNITTTSTNNNNNNNKMFTCTIGPAEKRTLAKSHVNNPDQLVNLLLQLTQ